MNLATIEQIIPELNEALCGRRFGRVFQLSKFDLAIDFRLSESRYLFISASPADPRIYLIRRRLRDIERSTIGPSAFANTLKKQLSNASVVTVDLAEGERVVEINLEGESEFGERFTRSLIVQLTGRSANLFVADDRGMILDRLRETQGDGQEIGTKFTPPARPASVASDAIPKRGTFDGSISEHLDRLDLEKRAADEFRTLVNAARTRLKQRIARHERRKVQLERDLANHGEPAKWKRFGDVLLANVATAKRDNGAYLATDYFDEEQSELSIPFENDDSVTETAEKYFRKYTKARNANEEVATRIRATDKEIDELTKLGTELDRAITEEDRDFIREFLVTKRQESKRPAKKKPSSVEGIARSFISSDGFEILVGKKAKDNDVLTFKIAKSLDTWMHAADYPGSHVVVRNPNRKEIPHRTLIEAAELAAFYSQGKAQVKAAVHYTQKKFVNKPKGAAPGLVSLSSFRTLLVEPKVPESLTT